MYSPVAAPPNHHSTIEREPDADRDPGRRLDGRFLGADGVRLAVHDEEVDEQQGDDDAEQRQPLPGMDVELDEVAAALGAREVVSSGGGAATSLIRRAPTIAWAAARRAIGTRNGEQLT